MSRNSNSIPTTKTFYLSQIHSEFKYINGYAIMSISNLSTVQNLEHECNHMTLILPLVQKKDWWHTNMSRHLNVIPTRETSYLRSKSEFEYTNGYAINSISNLSTVWSLEYECNNTTLIISLIWNKY